MAFNFFSSGASGKGSLSFAHVHFVFFRVFLLAECATRKFFSHFS